jgi:hypothetical protein
MTVAGQRQLGWPLEGISRCKADFATFSAQLPTINCRFDDNWHFFRPQTIDGRVNWRCGGNGRLGLGAVASQGGATALALGIHLQRGGMVNQPIDGGHGHGLVGKQRVPMAARRSGGDEQALALVALGTLTNILGSATQVRLRKVNRINQLRTYPGSWAKPRAAQDWAAEHSCR